MLDRIKYITTRAGQTLGFPTCIEHLPDERRPMTEYLESTVFFSYDKTGGRESVNEFGPLRSHCSLALSGQEIQALVRSVLVSFRENLSETNRVTTFSIVAMLLTLHSRAHSHRRVHFVPEVSVR